MIEFRLDIHRLTLRIKTNSARIKEIIDKYLLSCDCSLLNGPMSAYDVVFNEVSELDLSSIQRLKSAKFCRIAVAGCPLSYENDGSIIAGMDHYFFACNNPVARRLEIQVEKQIVEQEELFAYGLVRQLLKKMIYPFSNMIGIHAAAVVGKSESGAWLLCGAEGTGKSTTALHLSTRFGFKLLADDSPIISHLDRQSKVLASPDLPSITSNTLGLLPELTTLTTGIRPDTGKLLIDKRQSPVQRSDCKCSGAFSVDRIIMLTPAQVSKPIFAPVDKEAVLFQLLKETMIAFPPNPQPKENQLIEAANQLQFQAMTSLIENCSAFTLTFAPEHFDLLPSELMSA